MRKYLKTNWINLLIVLAFSIFTGGSYALDFQPGKTIYSENFIHFFEEMMLFLPFMFILIGLADVWISKDKVEKHIGGNSGIKGTIYVILLSMVQAGPLYGAFPVAFLLFKKGASIKNIFIYVGAFSTLKIPMLMFEIGFLGWKFSLIRTFVTLPFIILISLFMEKILKNKQFQVYDGSSTSR